MSSVFFHRFTVFVPLTSASPHSLMLNWKFLSINEHFSPRLALSLFKALLSGQGNLSDSEKHSRKTLPPADQGDTPFTTACPFPLLHDLTLCILKHELINFIWPGMLHLGYSYVSFSLIFSVSPSSSQQFFRVSYVCVCGSIWSMWMCVHHPVCVRVMHNTMPCLVWYNGVSCFPEVSMQLGIPAWYYRTLLSLSSHLYDLVSIL